jgi:hypothetical protein
MAKRSSRKEERDIRLSAAQLRQPGLENVARVEENVAVPAASQASDLPEEYRYVTADLQRIAIIAAVMLAVLVALALFLP